MYERLASSIVVAGREYTEGEGGEMQNTFLNLRGSAVEWGRLEDIR